MLRRWIRFTQNHDVSGCVVKKWRHSFPRLWLAAKWRGDVTLCCDALFILRVIDDAIRTHVRPHVPCLQNKPTKSRQKLHQHSHYPSAFEIKMQGVVQFDFVLSSRIWNSVIFCVSCNVRTSSWRHSRSVGDIKRRLLGVIVIYERGNDVISSRWCAHGQTDGLKLDWIINALQFSTFLSPKILLITEL